MACKFISVMGVVAVTSVMAAISLGHNQIAINIAFAPKRKTYSNARANVIINAAWSVIRSSF